MKKRLSLLLLCYTCLLLGMSNSKGQGFNTDFGQNRVQYHDFIWSYFESENFTTYFYQGGQDIAKFTTMVAEQSLPDIESTLEFKNNSRIDIMVYHNISDLKQTNMGLGIDATNTSGVTRIIGNKVFIHFDGNYQHLARDIRQGIARVLLEKMVYGGNIQEVLQNAVLLNLPNWFVSGLVSYIGEEWSTELDDQLREAIQQDRLSKFKRLNESEATFAGHALWNYIAQMHGPDAIPNLLYITRVNRSLESGFVFVLGRTLKSTVDEFNAYYQKVYDIEAQGRVSLMDYDVLHKSKKNIQKKRILYDEVKISPNGKHILYTTNELGRHKVFLYDIKSGKQKVILKTGFKSHHNPIKEAYPLIAWDRKSRKIAIVYEKRDEIRLFTYDLEKEEKETKPITKFQQVVDIAFTNSSKKLVVSAVKGGQLDLFMYAIPNTKVTRLTNDFFSDIQPRYIRLKDQEGILFASNRLNDTLFTARIDSILPLDNYDIYFYDLAKEEPCLVQVSNTPLANEYFPVQYDSTHISFISDQNGIQNRQVAYFDSLFIRTDRKVFFTDSLAINPSYPLDTFQAMGIIDTIIDIDHYKTIAKTIPISNYDHNILESDIAIKKGKSVQLSLLDGRYYITQSKLPTEPNTQKIVPPKTTYQQQLENLASGKISPLKKSKVNLPVRPNRRNNRNKPSKKNEEQIPSLIEEVMDTVIVEEAITATPTDSTYLMDNEDYYFQSEFDYFNANPTSKIGNSQPITSANNTDPVKTGVLKKAPNKRFKFGRMRTYKLRFSIDQVAAQLNNTIIFNQYESFNLNGGSFSPPDLGGLIKVGITDLFEDYRLIGGFRPSIGLGGGEYFIEYMALKKRFDKKLLFYRKSIRNTYQINVPDQQPFSADARNITNYLQASLIYPFDINTSLRGHIGYRGDRINFLAKDINSLALNPQQENWLFGKLEYVYDNSLNVGLNILNGTRYKIYAEIHKPFDGEINDRNFNFKFKDTGLLGIIGGDFRHYQKVHRQIIWANRAAGAFSFGSKKMIYYLGGVENWLVFDPNRRFNNETPISQTQNYAFQSLGTNLRGFQQNIRNGSSYMVINSELRVPLFTYLFQTPVRSEFFKNFQVVAFADVGTAWLGLSPFDEENQFNTVVVDGGGVVGPNEEATPPVVTTVRYFRNPIVAGYGTGVRTKLLGYFMKLDVAWGLDSGARTTPIWYLSMGLDF